MTLSAMCIAFFMWTAGPHTLRADWTYTCEEIVAVSHEYNLHPAIGLAVAWRESRLGRGLVGGANEIGPMQVRGSAIGLDTTLVRSGLRHLRNRTDLLGRLDCGESYQFDLVDGLCSYKGRGPNCEDGHYRLALANEIAWYLSAEVCWDSDYHAHAYDDFPLLSE